MRRRRAAANSAKMTAHFATKDTRAKHGGSLQTFYARAFLKEMARTRSIAVNLFYRSPRSAGE